MLPDNNIQEGLSCSYVSAIANISGFPIDFKVNDFGVDALVSELMVRSSGRTFDTGTHLNIQIKSTHNFRQNGTHIIYDLRNKNYNDLADTSGLTPKILVVLCMPQNKGEWLKQDLESLILKKCAYWTWLGNQPAVEDNDSTTAVHIPKSKVFSPEALKGIMCKIGNREDPDA